VVTRRRRDEDLEEELLNRLLGTLLFGVDPIDPGTMSAMTVMVVGLAALACWLPAWRASRLDASAILRAD
jgi:ABC-type lipoprotein release transport system permease subunit